MSHGGIYWPCPAAAGGLAIVPGYGDAIAQAAKRIERLDPALDQIISTAEPIVDIATNLGGTANVEGPLWWKEGGYLLMRGTNSKRWKYTPGQGISVFKENANGANGITRDPQGRLVACEAALRRVAREEKDGSVTVLASSFQGRPLNFPNDLVVKSDGAVYFTDPWAGPRAVVPPGENDLPFRGVYRISPDRGTLTLLVEDFLTPNGIAFSPDEKVLYICELRSAAISAPSTWRRTARSPARPTGFSPIWAAPSPACPTASRWIGRATSIAAAQAASTFSIPQGKKLGRIVHGFANTANVAFGGDDWKTLFFCTRTSLGSVRVKIAGVPVPAEKKA